MKKFLIIYHAPIEAMKQMAETTPEQQAKGLEEWKKWAQKCGDKLVDMGAPLMNGLEISPKGHTKNSHKNVAGYSIMQGENLEEIKALLIGHPHIGGWNADSTIEVHETIPIHGM